MSQGLVSTAPSFGFIPATGRSEVDLCGSSFTQNSAFVVQSALHSQSGGFGGAKDDNYSFGDDSFGDMFGGFTTGGGAVNGFGAFDDPSPGSNFHREVREPKPYALLQPFAAFP